MIPSELKQYVASSNKKRNVLPPLWPQHFCCHNWKRRVGKNPFVYNSIRFTFLLCMPVWFGAMLQPKKCISLLRWRNKTFYTIYGHTTGKIFFYFFLFISVVHGVNSTHCMVACVALLCSTHTLWLTGLGGIGAAVDFSSSVCAFFPSLRSSEHTRQKYISKKKIALFYSNSSRLLFLLLILNGVVRELEEIKKKSLRSRTHENLWVVHTSRYEYIRVTEIKIFL